MWKLKFLTFESFIWCQFEGRYCGDASTRMSICIKLGIYFFDVIDM